MDELRKAIRDLLAKLEQANPGKGSVERYSIILLRRLAGIAGRTTCAADLDNVIDGLRGFYIRSVPWCSELSRDIEKLLIIHEALSDADSRAPGSGARRQSVDRQ